MIYKILQIKYHTDYSFMDYEYAKEHGFALTDYVEVYKGTIEKGDGTDLPILDDLFYKFNCSQPTDFKGHSLSVSDIIVLEDKYYYCNSVGWIKL